MENKINLNVPQQHTSDYVIAPVWSSVHIFGYGETLIAGKQNNGRIDNNKLTNITPLLAYLLSVSKNAENISLNQLHSLTIFNNDFIQFIPKPTDRTQSNENRSLKFLWNELDTILVENLVNEVMDKMPTQKKPGFNLITHRK